MLCHSGGRCFFNGVLHALWPRSRFPLRGHWWGLLWHARIGNITIGGVFFGKKKRARTLAHAHAHAHSSSSVAVAAQTPAAAAGAAKRAAKERIRASALQLAREIRKPRSYIGYVAFVLFAFVDSRPAALHRSMRSSAAGESAGEAAAVAGEAVAGERWGSCSGRCVIF